MSNKSSDTMGRLRNDIKRSEAVLTAVGDKMGLTPEGREWIIGAFDPFHDRQLDVRGFPDSNGADSVVQEVTETFTVSAPNGQTQNWDCHIIQFPFMGPIDTAQKSLPQIYNATADTTGAMVVGDFASVSAIGNGNTYIGGTQAYNFNTSGNSVDIFNAGVINQIGVTVPNGYLQNPYRVIAAAFEVYNTTPDLYKGGSVCVYKQPTASYTTATTVSIHGSGASVGYATACAMEAPPSNLAEAMLLTSARQWDAREGCYVINSVNNLGMQSNLANYTQPMYYTITPGDGTWFGSALLPQGVPGNTFSYYRPVNQNFMDFNQVGAIFSNLDPHTSLTVNVKYIIESFPTSSSVLQTLAKPSPQYDPAALELYSHLSSRAPVGVEVKYNGLGDWFMDGIKSVGSMVAPLAKAIPNPVVKMAMNALGGKGAKGKDKTAAKKK